MEKAKQVAKEFLSGDGKHKTTVDQDVRSAITEEHVRPHTHENVTTAIDKSVHQDHHQTRVQPVIAKETLPEQHHHNVIPVAHKTVHHGHEEETRNTLKEDAARFQSTTTAHDHTHSSSMNPTLEGERIHHHVHEHIQPVIQKDTVEPHVVHTTIPVHETHHIAPVHHETTTLPAQTLDEFKANGNQLDARDSQVLRDFDGCPKPFDKSAEAQKRIHGHTVQDDQTKRSSDLTGSGFGVPNNDYVAGGASNTDAGFTNNHSSVPRSEMTNETGKERTSLLDKLNPLHNDKKENTTV